MTRGGPLLHDLVADVEKVKADTVVMTYLDIPNLPTLRLQGRATGVNLRIEDLRGYYIIVVEGETADTEISHQWTSLLSILSRFDREPLSVVTWYLWGFKQGEWIEIGDFVVCWDGSESLCDRLLTKLPTYRTSRRLIGTAPTPQDGT